MFLSFEKERNQRKPPTTGEEFLTEVFAELFSKSDRIPIFYIKKGEKS